MPASVQVTGADTLGFICHPMTEPSSNYHYPSSFLVVLPGEHLLETLRDIPTTNTDRLRFAFIHFAINHHPHRGAGGPTVYHNAGMDVEEFGNSQRFGKQAQSGDFHFLKEKLEQALLDSQWQPGGFSQRQGTVGFAKVINLKQHARTTIWWEGCTMGRTDGPPHLRNTRIDSPANKNRLRDPARSKGAVMSGFPLDLCSPACPHHAILLQNVFEEGFDNWEGFLMFQCQKGWHQVQMVGPEDGGCVLTVPIGEAWSLPTTGIGEWGWPLVQHGIVVFTMHALHFVPGAGHHHAFAHHPLNLVVLAEQAERLTLPGEVGKRLWTILQGSVACNQEKKDLCSTSLWSVCDQSEWFWMFLEDLEAFE